VNRTVMMGFGTTRTTRESGFSRHKDFVLVRSVQTGSYKGFLHLSGSINRMFNTANTKATALTDPSDSILIPEISSDFRIHYEMIRN
jgi:hypothetical protein